MSKLRAALCVAMCIILLFSFSSFAFAKGGETAQVSISADKASCAPGGDVEVTVSIATNYNAVAMRWFVLYTKSVFELAENDGGFAVTQDFENVGGSVSCNMTGNVSYPSGYSSDEYGIVLIQWVGGGENLAVFNQPKALDCFTFSLKVKDNAAQEAVGRIFVPDNSSYYNAALEDASDASTYYKADGLVCTFNDAQVVAKTPVAPQLFAVEGTHTVVDNEAKTIYGFTNGVGSAEDILGCVYAVGDDTVAQVDETSAGCGTGTVIRLVQDGETVESYTVVFFGDATGDGVVDESDFLMIDLYNAMIVMPEDDSPEFLGMDCNRDGAVDESDLSLVDLVVAFLGEIDQVNGGIIFY